MADIFPPASFRTPGVVQRVRPQPAAGSLVPLPKKVLLIGHRLSTASDDFDLQATRMNDVSTARSQQGAGAMLALMVERVFASGRLRRQVGGSVPEVWAMAVAPPSGTAATDTITFSGTATSTGSITINIAGRIATVLVPVGTAAADVGPLADTAIELLEPSLPATAAAAGAVVTLTAREPGDHGNYLEIKVDTTGVVGITAAVADGVAGAGVTDIEAALDASLGDDYQVVVVPQQDAATLTDVVNHIADAHDAGNDRPRVIVLGVDGTIGTAQTAASTLDDYRIVVANAEKPASPVAARSLSLPYELGAEVGALLISQPRPNPNLNKSRIVTPGRGQELLNSSDEIASGVTVIQPPTGIDHGGRVLRPVSTAITDQTGATSAPDTRWQPIEIALTVIETWLQMRVALERFAVDPELGINSEANRQSARQTVLSVLTLEQAANYLLFEPDEQDVQYETIGGSTRLRVTLRYSVVTATDIVAVTHDLVR